MSWRQTRAAVRCRRTQQAQQRLEEFTQLVHLDHVHAAPIKHRKSQQPNFSKCAEMLSGVYASETASDIILSTQSLGEIHLFTVSEVRRALKCMKKGRCADRKGVVLELFLHGGPVVADALANFFNGMLAHGAVSEDWYNTHTHTLYSYTKAATLKIHTACVQLPF